MKKLSPDIITLPWCEKTAEFFFAAVSDQPWSMLLHSGYSSHIYGRFDILVADPIGTIVTHGNITKVSLKETFASSEDPLVLINEALNICNFNAKSHPDFPFQGGALGFFGYDLIHRFEKLTKSALSDINLPDMAVGLYDWSLTIDHYKQQVTLLSYSDINARLAWLKLQKKSLHTDFRLTTPWHANMNYKEYVTKFNLIQDYLHSGDCYQVNLAQRFQAEYEGDEWQAFTCLNMQNRAPFSSFLRIEKGVIIGLSPERFIRILDNHIQTRPIKGTLPRLLLPKEDIKQVKLLANSTKDRTENLMIVDLMRNDIGRVAKPGTVLVPELFVVEKFPSVYHLVSTITAYLSPVHNACDLLRAAFPGGSVTGVPKIRAMEIIDELEPHCRNAWCGVIGYLSSCGNMDTSINIRMLIAVDNKHLYCYAGGGIIVDSSPQGEYQETFDKVNNILKQFRY